MDDVMQVAQRPPVSFRPLKSALAAIFIALNLTIFILAHTPLALLITGGLNLFALIAYLLLRRSYILPLRRILDLMHHLQAAENEAMVRKHGLSLQDSIHDAQMRIQTLLTAYRQHQRIEQQLAEAHAALSRFHHEQEILVGATSGEITRQYQTILAYAHYLEDRIANRSADPSLREDYDEVCEQAFNLQIIVQAMGILQATANSTILLQSVSLAERMISIMLDLTPSLDRRAMKLTTIAWDETVYANSHSEFLTLSIWMLLLGCVRFAEDESTLTLSCIRRDHDVIMDVTVSFLNAASITPTERLEFLEHKLREGERDAPMFASILGTHGNIQLARLLASRIGANITITPLTPYSCSVALVLPPA
ncbi:MAG: hypothetical protein ACK5WQ_01875 [Alphaproteobacteria bacterium]